ncbi:unnamed protein product [Linum trigynum]|uniref:Uncharacterized protein n=1 Tax=Linum trigynum TaxID=586398 RepID=A0AAV2GDW3_9ROSI
MRISHHQFARQIEVTTSGERLGHQIGNLIFTRNMEKTKNAIPNQVSYVVKMKLNMLSTLVKHRVGGYLNSTCIFNIELERYLALNPEITKKPT